MPNAGIRLRRTRLIHNILDFLLPKLWETPDVMT
jgi:hypothetical protein